MLLTSMKEFPWEAQIEGEVGHMSAQLPLCLQQGLKQWEEKGSESAHDALILVHKCINEEPWTP